MIVLRFQHHCARRLLFYSVRRHAIITNLQYLPEFRTSLYLRIIDHEERLTNYHSLHNILAKGPAMFHHNPKLS